MSNNKVRCVNCEWIIENRPEDIKIFPSEKYLCQKDGCTKTIGDIFARRECSWCNPTSNRKFPELEEPEGNNVICQQCGMLHKISYKRARPTHHENWQRSCDGSTCQYEDTVAERVCPAFNKGKPHDKTNLGW